MSIKAKKGFFEITVITAILVILCILVTNFVELGPLMKIIMKIPVILGVFYLSIMTISMLVYSAILAGKCAMDKGTEIAKAKAETILEGEAEDTAKIQAQMSLRKEEDRKRIEEKENRELLQQLSGSYQVIEKDAC